MQDEEEEYKVKLKYLIKLSRCAHGITTIHSTSRWRVFQVVKKILVHLSALHVLSTSSPSPTLSNILINYWPARESNRTNAPYLTTLCSPYCIQLFVKRFQKTILISISLRTQNRRIWKKYSRNCNGNSGKMERFLSFASIIMCQ